MKKVTLAFANVWTTFEPDHACQRFPELFQVADIEVVSDPLRADILFYSCFEKGHKNMKPSCPIPAGAGPVRLFYTGENVPPNFAECDFAITFSREVCDSRHLRLPNSIGALAVHGGGFDELEKPRPSLEEARALLRQKSHFCAYVQGNRVPFRESFVKALGRYKHVVCAGPSLNNTGSFANRAQKYDLFRDSKFAVAFENEASLGYTTEKLPDALVSDCVPIYWGDPAASLDFNEEAYIIVRSAKDVEAAIERVIALDQDDGAYLEVLRANRFPRGERPRDYQSQSAVDFFRRVVQAA